MNNNIDLLGLLDSFSVDSLTYFVGALVGDFGIALEGDFASVLVGDFDIDFLGDFEMVVAEISLSTFSLQSILSIT